MVSVSNLLFLCAVLFSAILVDSLSYDYSASIECLAVPPRSQYAGGILHNPEFNSGLKGWSAFGYASIVEKLSEARNRFSLAYNRSRPHQSISQKVYLRKGKLYTFSGLLPTFPAWVQISKGITPVTVVFKTTTNFTHAGSVIAKSGCWSMLKGGLSVEASGPAEFYFESKNTEVDIWVDSVSLQPFSKKQWRAHQDENIDKLRKRMVRFQAVDTQGNILSGANISIQQTRSGFPFGCAVAVTILNNALYQQWFTSRFTITTFENEMKWYSTENNRGKEDYSIADSMLNFMEQHRIAVRGHNILWDDPSYQPWWVKSLSPSELKDATNKRVNSIVTRYKGKLIAWDVINENLHFDFFEDKLGENASGIYYQMVHQLDANALLFLNDYNTLEEPGDGSSTPAKYLEKLKEMQRFTGNGVQVAIGLEGHFNKPNIPYMRSTIDTLASANMPIWLTEVDVAKDPNQAQYLEQILREAYSHPSVRGIIMWAGWHPEGCNRMCLTDNNFKNLPTGDVVDKLIKEWKTSNGAATTDSNGFFETQLFHGEYEIRIDHPSTNISSIHRLTVDGGTSHEGVFHVEVQARRSFA